MEPWRCHGNITGSIGRKNYWNLTRNAGVKTLSTEKQAKLAMEIKGFGLCEFLQPSHGGLPALCSGRPKLDVTLVDLAAQNHIFHTINESDWII